MSAAELDRFGLDPMFSAGEVEQFVASMADAIARNHPDGVVLVGVLKASVTLVADLARALHAAGIGDVVIDFLETSSFGADSGRVRLVHDVSIDLSGRPVVIVSTLIDTGLRLGYLCRQMALREPSSLELAVLFDKSSRRLLPLDLDYVGTSVPDRFLIGYGLDRAGHGRHTHSVAAAGPAAEPTRAALAAWVVHDHGRHRERTGP